jgi:hypothetical protein
MDTANSGSTVGKSKLTGWPICFTVGKFLLTTGYYTSATTGSVSILTISTLAMRNVMPETGRYACVMGAGNCLGNVSIRSAAYMEADGLRKPNWETRFMSIKHMFQESFVENNAF